MTRLTLTVSQRRHLEDQLRSTRDAHVYGRTLAILEVADGEPVSTVARRLRVTPRAVYHWRVTYTRDRTPDTLRDAARSGRPTVLTDADRDLIRDLLKTSPQDRGYFATQWTVPLLQDYLAHYIRRPPSDDTLRRELQRLGFTWKRSRYTLDPDPEFRGKKEADRPPNPGFADPQCRLGRGRD